MLSRTLEQTLHRALAQANVRRHEYATLEHLLYALGEDGDAVPMLEACGVDIGRLRKDLERYFQEELANLVTEQIGDARPTAGFQRTLQRAAIHVQSAGREKVTGANVLVAMFSERESNAVFFLEDQDMSRLDAVNYLSHGIHKAEPGEGSTRRPEDLASTKGATIRQTVSGIDYWIRKSPYFEATRRAGCRHYTVANHMYQPGGYDDPVAEYWKLVKDVTLWDVATERQVEITGRDAFAFANLLTPRDLTKCPVGSCRYTVVTAEDGGIVNDPVLLRLAKNHFWLSCSDSDLLLWAKGVAVHAGLKVEIKEPDVSPIQLQGPKSRPVMETLFGAEIAALGYYRLVETELNGIPLVVTRTGWSGGLGYELFLRDGAYGETLWQAVLQAGKPHGIAVTGPSDIRRVEAGILGYGADMGLDTNPYEVGLERLVEFDQEAVFIGKAALAKIKKRGVKRRLVGIEILGEALTTPFKRRWPVKVEGAQVGEVTVAVRSPSLEKNIGYAMVPVELAALGTRLTVETTWGAAVAVVVEKPFVKRATE